jgi:phosphate transport system substrate-binding protein
VTLIILIFIFLFTGCTNSRSGKNPENDNSLNGTITISGAWALYPMAVKWAEEFQKIHPGIQIDISAGGAGKGMADALADIADIGMVSRNIYQEEIDKGAWWVAVTKDAVVPVISEANPALEELLIQGVDRNTFIDIWITGNATDWQNVVSIKNQVEYETEIHVYTRSDSCGAAQVWAEFLGGNQEDLLGIGIYGDPGLLEAVNKDALGIGYNNINYAYDANTKQSVKGVKILPVDINNNGKIDEEEDFFDNIDAIISAIAEDKYPSPPARDLYFVTYGKPQNTAVLEFIKWILTDGQQYVHDAGYINLNSQKISEELAKLEDQ